MSDSQPCRSFLYMPASNDRALEKAKSLPADGYIFDLEDAVRPDAKAAAREQAVEAANSGAYGRKSVLIRANGLDTPWGQADISAIACSEADGIVVPKVNCIDDVNLIEDQMDAAGAPETFQLWIMMETPAAFLNAASIAGAGGRLKGMIIGSNDLIKDMRARHIPDRSNILPALTLALLAARAHGLVILDAVYNAIKDEEGFIAEARQALTMGFDGKSLVHPAQIAPANRVFSPAEEEVEEAHAIIAAYEEAFAAGKGVAAYQGKMIEDLHVAEAKRLVAVAQAIAAFDAE
ncbi:citrate lyase subunit beta [Kordiimonas sediminis]|uniref:Citrate lyase subunit beta n=1 Tax=Kordiimonas sediminis TaxID=1735581 RepID=A0A919E1Z1_9PROT|nr:CoA ester lyase [Kordiimonas sediminis]GHF11468.1 citrate lyase subunit beta [Kordiimonas sediminis]